MEQALLEVHGWMSGGGFWAGAGCLLWGLVSVALSPCHLASIPLMVGYVGGQQVMARPRQAAQYALAFTLGLFFTIALIGALSALVGRMAGDISPYWTILVAALLFWVGMDMLGLASLPISGALLGRLKLRGLGGALVLGLAYGLLSGACTVGFLAPVMALVATQESWLASLMLVLLFGLGHCLPIVLAGSSTALVQRLMNSGAHRQGSLWFRRLSGVLVMALGVYLALSPFLGES